MFPSLSCFQDTPRPCPGRRYFKAAGFRKSRLSDGLQKILRFSAGHKNADLFSFPEFFREAAHIR